MVYECIKFAEIIETNNSHEYEKLKEWSRKVMRVTEEARKQNNIIFGVER
jgi:hypothetical protein